MDAGLATAAAVLARVLGVVTGGAAVLPETSARIRLAFAVALAVVALPLAVETQRTDTAPAVGRPADVAALVAGEAVLGLACGAALAAAASAGAWAGGILGSVAGLSWSDDFAPEGDAQAAGMARLAWWISCGVFLAAGGLQTIVVAIVDSVRLVPVGSLLALGTAPGPALGRLAAEIPGVAFSLALALSVPALLAVIGFHLVMAVALRTVPLVPGIGLLQALAALVLLGAVCLGADAWVHGFPDLVQGPVERIFGPR